MSMVFVPNYGYTHEMVANLTRIAGAREVIDNAYLVPKWEAALREEWLVASAHASTAIEGNTLTQEEVSELQRGREIMASRKDRQEVINYLKVLGSMEELAAQPYSEALILRLHEQVTRETLRSPEYEGRYREVRVIVGNPRTGEVTFRPPPPEEAPGQMIEFVDWLGSEKAGVLDPVMMAGLAHYEFVRIHPFVDGNGRTARALATLILVKRGFDVHRFFALDDYYDHQRGAYYAALQTVRPELRDLTRWLEYFTAGVAHTVEAVKARVLELSGTPLRLAQKGRVALTKRQMTIVEQINRHGKITSSEVGRIFGFSRQAGLKELNKLAALEVVEKVGQGRGAGFVLR